MEQKRTLLIVAAVGIFLLVVLGAALILNSATSTAAKTDIENPAIQVTNDWLLPEGEIKTISSGEDLSNGSIGSSQDTSTAQPSDIIAADSPVTSDNALIVPATTTFTTTGSQDGNTTSSTLSTTVTPSSPATTTVQITQNSYSTQQPSPVTVITPKPVVQQPKRTTAASETKQQSAKKPSTPQKNFWVQVGSFNKKSGADTTRQSLSAQGIQSEIFTYTADNGSTGFRVRVGPYQTRSEAEYWMKLVEEKTGTKGFITETK